MRFKSIDVFRGLTVALMIIVNAVDGSTSYNLLSHSDWNGCSLADLVFPFFLLIVGISSVLSLSVLRNKGMQTQTIVFKIMRRSCFIFLIGLLLNAYPHHLDFSPFRLLGVLQRIAICYCAVSLLYLTVSVRAHLLISILLLLGYWFLLTQVPVPGFAIPSLAPIDNWSAFLDRHLIPGQYLYHPNFDPEGFLSTIPAIATTLIGSLMGSFLLAENKDFFKTGRSQMHKERFNRLVKQFILMVLVSLMLIGLGWIWNLTFPINKTLWTSAFVLWTSGWGILVFAICFGLIEIKQWSGWSTIFELLGLNALIIFVLHVFILKSQYLVHLYDHAGRTVNLKTFIMMHINPYMSLKNATLSYGVLLTAFMVMCAATIVFVKKTALKK